MRQLDAFVVITHSRYMVLSAVASAAATMFVVVAPSSSGTTVPFLPLALSLLVGISIGLASSVPSTLTLRCSLWRFSSSGYLKNHPDFNKSGPWEKSAALAKLKAKYPDDESRHRLNRKVKIDGTELNKPIEIPKRSDKAKGKKGTTPPGSCI